MKTDWKIILLLCVIADNTMPLATKLKIDAFFDTVGPFAITLFIVTVGVAALVYVDRRWGIQMRDWAKRIGLK
jgi:hypothetical protein